MKKDDNESDSIKPNYKGNSPIALEAKQSFLKNKSLIENLTKKIAINESKVKDSLLDENRIKEQ
jgi:hypothetical protein